MRSETEFIYLRDGGGEPLWVREDGSEPSRPGDPLAELKSRNQVRTRVYGDAGGFALDVEGVGWFGIDPEASSITFPPTPYGAWLEGFIWGLPAALLVLSRGGLFFHAAAVDIGGRAVLLAGPGHHGKTTLAGALAAAGHRLLAEDLVRCHVEESPVLYPGPAMLRLRRDVARWLAVPGAERVAEDPEKVHLALDPSRRGTSDPVPLAAIVFLHPGEAVSIERLEPGSTIPDLWVVSLNVPTSEGRAQCFRHITGLAETVPVWKMVRPLTRKAIAPTIDRIVEVSRTRS